MTDPYVIEMTETGGPEVLRKVAREPRQPGPGQALIKQSAIGLNFIDTYQRTGLYPVPMPNVLGSEGAGIVEAVGDGVSHIKPGDRVAYMGAGTYASHYTAKAATMIKLPDHISEAEAAGVLIKGLTAWMLLFEIRRANPGETALVWAPVGGVGSVVVPWATSMGVRVIGVTSSEEKAAKARTLGASDVVLSSVDVAAEVRALTDGKGVDVSYDSVGKTSAAASLDSLKPRGWWISFGNASGAVEPIAPGILAQKGALILTRPTLGPYLGQDNGMARGAAAVFGALRTGTISAPIGQTVALEDVGDAHRALESGKTTGSTILIP